MPKKLQDFIGSKTISEAPAYRVETYKELLNWVAKLATLNKDHLLFFRGQSNDHRNQNGSSTFFPSIYRERLKKDEVKLRFERLRHASKILVESFRSKKLDGYTDIRRKKHMPWSILQHYEVCKTPLLDFTHSLRVACSFAKLGKDNRDFGYIYVFALPYITNRISINSEHDIVNVRLLSICPPDALRPYYQDGYLAGTEDITTNYGKDKEQLDFKRRLIAKFQITFNISFWEEELSPIPRTALYPKGDKILTLCEEIKKFLEYEFRPEEIKQYFKLQSEYEEMLNEKAKKFAESMS